MQFTGRNLHLVRRGIDYALAEVHNMIATCPDPQREDFAEALEEYEKEQAELEKLLARIDRAIALEEQ